MNHAAKWFREDVVELLRGRIRILTTGVDVNEHMSNHTGRRKHRERAQILVNHRLLKYTGVRALLTDVFPELWRRRKDFQVVVTNPTRVRLPGVLTKVPWLKLETLPRPDYIRSLWDSDIVVAPHRATYWSMSTMEAICAECVPLMNRESFFAEMLAAPMSRLSAADKDHIEQRWFFFRGSIVDRLSDLLDNLGKERRIAKRLSQHARQIYDWDALGGAWLQIFREAEQAIPVMSQSIPSMRQIIKLIRSEGPISKAEILRRLRWAPKQRALSWTAFRKGLKAIATEDSLKPEAIFQANRE
jgi:glycosyltransferase involved in cell wall biosynthesis